MFPRWLFTSDRFRITINNFHSFLQRYFHYHLSWPSSDLLTSLDWVIKSLGHRPSPYSLNNTLKTTGPHNYIYIYIYIYRYIDYKIQPTKYHFWFHKLSWRQIVSMPHAKSPAKPYISIWNVCEVWITPLRGCLVHRDVTLHHNVTLL